MNWMGISDVWTFVIAVLVFLAIPGPGNFAVLTATGKGGKRGGYAAAAGIILGDQVLMWTAVAGLAALLAANPMVFTAVQYLGAAYLVWIGIQLLRAKPGAGSGVIKMDTRRFFRQGFLITLLNPKAIVFYMAFFPLFINPKTHLGLPTFAAMAVLIALLTFLYCTAAILIGDALAARVRANRAIGTWLERAAGVFLIGFGIKLGTN
jgi:leucine efflux protein